MASVAAVPTLSARQQREFADAMRAEMSLPMIRTAPAAGAVKPRPVIPAAPLAPHMIEIGRSETGAPLGIDPAKLIEGRLLIQGASGAGKSWTLRRLLEQTANLIQQIVIDPEGDLPSLSEKFQHLVIDGSRLDPGAIAVAARRIREHRLSVVLDLSDMEREAQMHMIAVFITTLIEAPREQWTPALIAIDEAHLFAPFGGQASESSAIRKASIAAIVDLMSRGRKRGLAGVLATQRLARLSKSVISDVHSYLVGKNVLDLDVRRAAETIGWDARRAFDRLPMLMPGEFVAVGPAFSTSPTITNIGAVETTHRGTSPTLLADAPMTIEDAAKLLDLASLVDASERDRDTRGETTPALRAIRTLVRDPAFPLAARLIELLRPLFPNGATFSDIVKTTKADKKAVAEAIALFDAYGVFEVDTSDNRHIVRLDRSVIG